MNGYTNYETYNVALWLANDESLYNIAKRYSSYDRVQRRLESIGLYETEDGVSFTDSKLNFNELNEFLGDL